MSFSISSIGQTGTLFGVHNNELTRKVAEKFEEKFSAKEEVKSTIYEKYDGDVVVHYPLGYRGLSDDNRTLSKTKIEMNLIAL